MNKEFLQWWLVFVLQVIAFGVAYYHELHLYALAHDQTYLSSVLFVIWLVTSIKIGLRIFKKTKTSTEPYWYVAETCMSIGMIGTVLGFILMLDGSNLASIDPSNIQSMKTVIGQLAEGMATALLTTLMGLIVSIALRAQLILGSDD
jgi:hypothetical protein